MTSLALAAPLHMYPIIFTSSFSWHNTEHWGCLLGVEGREGGGGDVEVERTKAKIIFLFSFLVYEFACKSEVLDIQWYLLRLVGVCWRCIAQFIFIRMHFWFFFAACTLVNITGFVTSCELACCQDNLCDPSAPTSASLALVANVCAILLANVLIIFAWFY